MGPPGELLSLPSVRYYISFIVINKWSKHTVLARDLAVSLSHTASLSNMFGRISGFVDFLPGLTLTQFRRCYVEVHC